MMGGAPPSRSGAPAPFVPPSGGGGGGMMDGLLYFTLFLFSNSYPIFI